MGPGLGPGWAQLLALRWGRLHCDQCNHEGLPDPADRQLVGGVRHCIPHKTVQEGRGGPGGDHGRHRLRQGSFHQRLRNGSHPGPALHPHVHDGMVPHSGPQGRQGAGDRPDGHGRGHGCGHGCGHGHGHGHRRGGHDYHHGRLQSADLHSQGWRTQETGQDERVQDRLSGKRDLHRG